MNYTLTFTNEEMQIIHDALIERPFKQVASLLNSITMQVTMPKEVKESPDVTQRDT